MFNYLEDNNTAVLLQGSRIFLSFLSVVIVGRLTTLAV